MLNAELKFMNSILTYESFLSRVVEMASLVDQLDQYANWNGFRGGGRLDVMHDYLFKALHEDGGKCNRTVVIEAGWRWLLRNWNDCGSSETCGNNSLTQ